MKLTEEILNIFENPLNNALGNYEDILKIKFENPTNFVLTPKKPNSARKIFQANYENSIAGKFYTIVFAQGDGTGDSKTYSSSQLIIPDEFKYQEKQERVFPRSKSGVFCEGFFPLFSLNPNKDIIMFASSLNELTLKGKKIIRLKRLGLNNEDYSNALDGNFSPRPKIDFTVWYSKDGTRYGDPHSIHYSKNLTDSLQVVGFLAIDKDNPLLNKFKELYLSKNKK